MICQNLVKKFCSNIIFVSNLVMHSYFSVVGNWTRLCSEEKKNWISFLVSIILFGVAFKASK